MSLDSRTERHSYQGKQRSRFLCLLFILSLVISRRLQLCSSLFYKKINKEDEKKQPSNKCTFTGTKFWALGCDSSLVLCAACTPYTRVILCSLFSSKCCVVFISNYIHSLFATLTTITALFLSPSQTKAPVC